MDWEPSARPGNRTAPSSPAIGGHQPAGNQTKVAANPQEMTAPDGPRPATAAQPAAQPAGGAHDPWTRAVEQAPGVWVVGDKSNVGANTAPASANDNIGASATVPHYAPATVPVAPEARAAATAAGWDPGAVSRPVQAEPAAGTYQSPVPGPAPAPEFAMAAAAPVPVAQAAVTQPAVPQATVAPSRPQPGPAAPASAPVAPRTETRQSLYQRLSNSPEAEAGRAKAPARAAAAPSAYVQDIPSADDETIEESGVFGRAAVERILGGKLIEERSLDGSPVPPRY